MSTEIKTIRHNYYLLVMVLLISIYSSASMAETMVGVVNNMTGKVEVISDNARAIDFGDDIILNDKIKVGADSSLVLTYYAGCRQEWFSQNSVIKIGKDKSDVISGKLEKSEVFDCEVPGVVLSDKDSFKKAAFHFRGVSAKKNTADSSVMTIIKDAKTKSWRVDTDQQSADDVKLRMWTAKKDTMYYRSGEQIIIYLVANKDAYLNLNYFQADGNVVHLIPNIFEEKHKIKAGQIYVVGGNKSKLKLVVEHPYGEETLSALVSTKPFAKEFKATEIIEKTAGYKSNTGKKLSSDKSIAEYALGIWSAP
jgi:hypothetical protein